MNGHGNALDATGAELCCDGRDGIIDPGADAWVAGLVDGEIVGANGGKGRGRVEVAMVEESVDCYCKEGGKGGEQGRGFVEGEGWSGGV